MKDKTEVIKMKKFLAIMLVLALAVTTLAIFTACNKGESADVVKVIDIKLTEEEYAFCVNKSDATLLANVNTFLAQIKSNGTFDTIVNKYFGDGTPSGVVSAAEGTADALVVATNAAFEPFEYLDGNTFYGIDMEIAQALATYLGKVLVIKNINFDSIFSEIEAGNADIGMAGITINETRKQQVQFSNAYYDASQMLIVKFDDSTFDNCTTATEVETILKTFTSSTKIGVQNGTTGHFYVEGDEDWGFDGFAVTCKPYNTAALAIQDMINGNIDYVIVDEAPAKKISAKMNSIA